MKTPEVFFRGFVFPALARSSRGDTSNHETATLPPSGGWHEARGNGAGGSGTGGGERRHRSIAAGKRRRCVGRPAAGGEGRRREVEDRTLELGTLGQGGRNRGAEPDYARQAEARGRPGQGRPHRVAGH